MICNNVLEEEEIVSCKNLCIPLYFRIWLVGGSRNLGIFLEIKCSYGLSVRTISPEVWS